MIGGKGYGPGPAEMEESRKGTEKGAGGVFFFTSLVRVATPFMHPGRKLICVLITADGGPLPRVHPAYDQSP